MTMVTVQPITKNSGDVLQITCNIMNEGANPFSFGVISRVGKAQTDTWITSEMTVVEVGAGGTGNIAQAINTLILTLDGSQSPYDLEVLLVDPENTATVFDSELATGVVIINQVQLKGIRCDGGSYDRVIGVSLPQASG